MLTDMQIRDRIDEVLDWLNIEECAKAMVAIRFGWVEDMIDEQGLSDLSDGELIGNKNLLRDVAVHLKQIIRDHSITAFREAIKHEKDVYTIFSGGVRVTVYERSALSAQIVLDDWMAS